METKVKLRDVAGEFDICPPEGHAYLNKKTGEVYGVEEEYLRLADPKRYDFELEDDEDVEDWGDDEVEEDELEEEEEDSGREKKLADWEREHVAKAKEILASKDWVELPGRAEFAEYRVMEDFIAGVKDKAVASRLDRATHGKGAFRRFKDGVHREGVAESWYAFRETRLNQFIAEWLDSQEIAFER